MANPEAVMRAASAGPKPPMGGTPPAGGPPAGAPAGGPPSGPKPPMPGGEGGGMDDMVGALEGVGKFLQAQGANGQKALQTFQALLQEMAALGGEGGEKPPMNPEEPKESGRMDMNRLPGTQVL